MGTRRLDYGSHIFMGCSCRDLEQRTVDSKS